MFLVIEEKLLIRLTVLMLILVLKLIKVILNYITQRSNSFRVTLKEGVNLCKTSYKIIDVLKGGHKNTNDTFCELNESYKEMKYAYETQKDFAFPECIVLSYFTNTCQSLI